MLLLCEIQTKEKENERQKKSNKWRERVRVHIRVPHQVFVRWVTELKQKTKNKQIKRTNLKQQHDISQIRALNFRNCVIFELFLEWPLCVKSENFPGFAMATARCCYYTHKPDRQTESKINRQSDRQTDRERQIHGRRNKQKYWWGTTASITNDTHTTDCNAINTPKHW